MNLKFWYFQSGCFVVVLSWKKKFFFANFVSDLISLLWLYLMVCLRKILYEEWKKCHQFYHFPVLSCFRCYWYVLPFCVKLVSCPSCEGYFRKRWKYNTYSHFLRWTQVSYNLVQILESKQVRAPVSRGPYVLSATGISAGASINPPDQCQWIETALLRVLPASHEVFCLSSRMHRAHLEIHVFWRISRFVEIHFCLIIPWFFYSFIQWLLLQILWERILIQARRKADSSTGKCHVVVVWWGRQRTEPTTAECQEVFLP